MVVMRLIRSEPRVLAVRIPQGKVWGVGGDEVSGDGAYCASDGDEEGVHGVGFLVVRWCPSAAALMARVGVRMR